MTAPAVLLGDIGATNGRFALLTDGLLGPVKWIAVAHYPQFADAIDDFLQEHLHERLVENALFAVAGPVRGGRCDFTNCSWSIDGRDMRDRFKLQTVRIVNDFEATALSLPHLMEGDMRSLGGGRAISGAPMVVLGLVPDLGSRGWWGMVPTESLSQAKAGMRPWRPLHAAKMSFWINCANGSAMFRPNEYFQDRASKIFTAP
jgi:glucokinase